MPCPTTSGLPLLNCCGPTLPPGRYFAQASFPKHGFSPNAEALIGFLDVIPLPHGARKYLRVAGTYTNARDGGTNLAGEVNGNYLTGDATLTGDPWWATPLLDQDDNGPE